MVREIFIMTVQESATPGTRLGAKELRRLPAAEREAILLAAARQAEAEYCGDRQLTQFEAFGKDDLHGESASTEAR
jgi:alkylhydroperoxidase family enzyme